MKEKNIDGQSKKKTHVVDLVVVTRCVQREKMKGPVEIGFWATDKAGNITTTASIKPPFNAL